jgi:hypothetical protein
MTDEQIEVIMATVKLIMGTTPDPERVIETYESCLRKAQDRKRSPNR